MRWRLKMHHGGPGTGRHDSQRSLSQDLQVLLPILQYTLSKPPGGGVAPSNRCRFRLRKHRLLGEKGLQMLL